MSNGPSTVVRHRAIAGRAAVLGASAALLAGLLAGPLASVAAAGSPSTGHRSAVTVIRLGAANGFAGAPQVAAAGPRISSAAPTREFVDHPEHERPGVTHPSPGSLPTDAPKVGGKQVGSIGPGARGFAGLNHFDQRFASGGNQFSTEPPDGAICAGAGREVEMVNSALAAYDRKGNLLAGPIGVNEFFGLKPEINRTTGEYGPLTGDIKCLFDPGTERWFLSMINLEQDPVSGDFTGQTAVGWAVSKTSDPLGAFTAFEIDTTNGDGSLEGHPGCPCLGDQPLIGVDAYGFYITTNEFSFFGDEFNGAQVYAIDKIGLARAARGSGVPTAVQFDRIPLAEGPAYSLQPASPSTNGQFARGNGGTAYFLSALDFNNVFDNRIAAWAMTNTRSLGDAHPHPKLQSRVIRSETYGAPPLVEQKDGPTPLRDALAAGLLGDPVDNALSPLDGGDDRMASASLADGLLWGALTTAVKFDKDGVIHGGAAWFAVKPWIDHGRLKAKVVSQGYVAVKDQDVTYPGISVNPAGKGAIAFTLTGTDRFPSGAFVRVSRGGTSSIKLAATGAGPQDGFSGYKLAPTDPEPRPRWGDYNGTAVDETGHIWFETEYIGQSCTFDAYLVDQTCGGTRTLLANWGTFIGRVTP